MAARLFLRQAALSRLEQQQQLGSFFCSSKRLSFLSLQRSTSQACSLPSLRPSAAQRRPLLTSSSSFRLPLPPAAAAASPAAASVAAGSAAAVPFPTATLLAKRVLQPAAASLQQPAAAPLQQPATVPLQQRPPPCCSSSSSSSGVPAVGQPEWWTYTAKRTYLHFNRTLPEDFELPADTMPANVAELLSKDPKQMNFFENYWYWKLRGEATVLDPESLPKKSYKQLARDMGMQVVSEETEHMVGLLELYEHLKTATFVGPFGTIDKPVLCPSVTTDRIVGCTGGAGDKEHVPLWFRCREGFLYRCGECDQIFMLVRVFYSLPDGKDPFPVDPDVDDVFDAKLLEKGEKMWNSAEYVHWPAGHAAYSQLFLEGMQEQQQQWAS